MNDFLGLIGLIIVSIAILIGVWSCENGRGNNRYLDYTIHYSSFVVNGQTYQTDNVDKIEYHSGLYQNDIVYFYMKNGDKITCQADTITWQGKKD